MGELYAKLIINSCINSLGVIGGVSLGLEKVEGLREETITFCRRSLVKKEATNRKRKP